MNPKKIGDKFNHIFLLYIRMEFYSRERNYDKK